MIEWQSYQFDPELSDDNIVDTTTNVFKCVNVVVSMRGERRDELSLSILSTNLKGTIFLRELIFAVHSLEIFCGNLILRIFHLKENVEPFCKLFDLCFSHLKILRDLNFVVWAQIRKNRKN